MTGVNEIVCFVLGFLVIALAAQQIGRYFIRISLPLISGFLFTGIIAGPYVLNLISREAVIHLRFVDEFALAFIAFAAGNQLYLKDMVSRLRTIQWVTVGLVVCTMLLGTLAMLLMAEQIPFLRAMSLPGRLAVSLLAASILVARSPSSAIAIVDELRAKGPFTQTVLGVIVITDVLVIVLFAVSTSLANTLLTGIGFDFTAVGLLVLQLALSLLLGYLLGQALMIILSLPGGRQWLQAALILMTGYSVYLVSGAVRQASGAYLPFELLLEPLLICMVGGFVVTNYCDCRMEFSKILEETGPPVYILFFTLTGAALSLDVLVRTWPIALALFFVRGGAIFAGAFGGGLLAGESRRHNQLGWMTYITQAGIGLGLAKEVMVEFPGWGEPFATIMIAVIVLNQIIGPPLFKKAVSLAGEDYSRADTSYKEPEVREALIFGLENQSLALARQLRSNGWQTRIAATDAAREEAGDSDISICRIPDISLESLRQLNADQAEAIITMLSDEENYRICELAYENFGTPNLVVRLNDRFWMNRFYDLGARIVDPGTAIVGLMDQFVRSPSSTSLLLGMEADQTVVEVELRNPNLHGLALRDLRLPLDTLILSIRRQGQLLISHGYTRLAVGDRITLVGPKKSLETVELRFDVNRESALVNLVEQVTPREIAGKSLESEVKEMIRPEARTGDGTAPDGQPRDRFDRFIEESMVIDIRENIDVEKFYEIVAAALSEKLAMTAEELFDLFISREKESSTAITQGLAIPHIIIEGSHKFCILLVRCNNGIYFSESAPMVYAVFVLIGTRDERTFHLQALSAIAQVVQNTGFEKRWRRARGEHALRNLILASSRKRLL